MKKMTHHFFLFNDVKRDVPLWARQDFYKRTKLNHSAFHCLVVNNIRLRHVATPPFPIHPVRQRQGAKQTRLPLSTPTACFPTPPGQELLFWGAVNQTQVLLSIVRGSEKNIEGKCQREGLGEGEEGSLRLRGRIMKGDDSKKENERDVILWFFNRP